MILFDYDRLQPKETRYHPKLEPSAPIVFLGSQYWSHISPNLGFRKPQVVVLDSNASVGQQRMPVMGYQLFVQLANITQ